MEKLLARPDDQLVVMATGDEMTVEFSPRALPAVKPGWKRDFFLDLRGYAKDGEPNTAFAWTVEPLPFSGMSNYPPSPSDRVAEHAGVSAVSAPIPNAPRLRADSAPRPGDSLKVILQFAVLSKPYR